MTAENAARLMALARNPDTELIDRIAALKELGGTQDRELAMRLRDLWQRFRPTEPQAENWDPEAAERVVDLHLILALYRLGDSSLVPQIAPLVAKAGEVLTGPYNEHQNAAEVLRGVGALGPVQQVVQLADHPALARNAVRTLQLLNLPVPPTGGPLSNFPQLSHPVSFSIQRFSEELEALVRVGNGLIALSPGAQALAVNGDYERGPVTRFEVSLTRVLTEELDLLDLVYAETRPGVAICTFPEAGARWLQLWPDLANRLVGHGWYR